MNPKKKGSRPQAFLGSAGLAGRVRKFRRRETIYAQGDRATSVLYIQNGGVKLTVVSASGKEAVVALLGPGDFFGEACLAGHSVRMSTAAALTLCQVVVVQKDAMIRALHEQPAFARQFIAHLLSRNIRVEEDLVDQLFNSSEKRLARALLLLARYGSTHQHLGMRVPAVSQDVLAEMIGTTRPRVNFFMNKFRKLGFIDYNGGLQVNRSLLTVVLHD